jgi:hypothetical protein
MPSLDPAAMPGGPPPGGPPGMPPKPPLPGGPSPTGPGASPALSPGDGAGRKAAALQQVKGALPALLLASMAFEPGSKEQQALIRAVSALNPIFGKAEPANMVPAALQGMAQAAAKGPMSAAPPPGIPPSPTPPRGMGAPPEGGEL